MVAHPNDGNIVILKDTLFAWHAIMPKIGAEIYGGMMVRASIRPVVKFWMDLQGLLWGLSPDASGIDAGMFQAQNHRRVSAQWPPMRLRQLNGLSEEGLELD